MDISYTSFLVFLITTGIYYGFSSIGKLPITTTTQLANYDMANLPRLGLYFLATIVTQFAVTLTYLLQKCGGSAGNNLTNAFMSSVLPWTFIFGASIATLMMFPTIKSAFADVLGYFAVANGANELLNNILLLNNDLSGIVDPNVRRSADAILKLTNNQSVLINTMHPENFNSIWNTLVPLMRQGVGADQKEKLLNLVVFKDNVGEAFWYIYTAIFVIVIVSFNMTSRGCKKDLQQIRAQYDNYIAQQTAAQQQQNVQNSTVYKL